jgi:carboxyl-terminal processing protease
MKSKKRIAPIAAALAVSVTILFISFSIWAQRDNLYDSLKLFSEVLSNVQSRYVRPIEADKLIRAAIEGIFKELDPHSGYMDEDEYKELRIGTTGQFGGLGITIGMTDDILTVISPLEGTPAFEAGIMAGDKIVKIEGESTKGITIDQAVKKLRGKPGTKVSISIQRVGVEGLIDFTIVRDIIKINAIPYSGMLTKDVGYLRLARFSRDAGRSVADVVDSLRGVGAKKFIVDLRGNSGGLLDEAVDVTEVFLDPGEQIVTTKGRVPGSSREYIAHFPSAVRGSPLIVLVDGGSASASEILSGSIQDWDRGLVVGTTTYGKGSVQTIMPLSNGAALRLTTAEWYTPSGRLINKPDSLHAEAEEVKDSSAVVLPKEIFHTVGGLNRAVYGGGGITPDLELEGERIDSLATVLARGRRFFDFAIKYKSAHKKVEKPFKATAQVIADFKSYLADNDVEYSEAQFDSSSDHISRMIELEISSSLWGTQGRYESMLSRDPWVEKAVDLLDMSHASGDLFTLAEKTKGK